MELAGCLREGWRVGLGSCIGSDPLLSSEARQLSGSLSCNDDAGRKVPFAGRNLSIGKHMENEARAGFESGSREEGLDVFEVFEAVYQGQTSP